MYKKLVKIQKVGAIKEGKYTITLLGLGLLNVQSVKKKKRSHHF